MADEPLGRLVRVELRDIWATEAQDFTPWLAGENNLKVLGDTIQMDLELEAQERNVGPFRADILCRNTDDSSWVLIENQLERTDHIHLGQLLTYAAGLHAVTIVWVAANFTDEHRATLDWLNEITDDSFRFFGLEVELWRIGESPAAPKFSIISKPNDWTRSISQAARRISESDLTETKALQLRYWSALREYMQEHDSPIRSKKPAPRQWIVYGIGRAGFNLAATVHTREHRLGVELYLGSDDAKSFFHLLMEQKDDIESDIGAVLDWRELPERKSSRIILFKEGVDPTDEADWANQHAWIANWLEKFEKAFRQRVKELDASEWEYDDTTKAAE